MNLLPNKQDAYPKPITDTRISASEWNQLVGSCMAFITAAGLTPDASDNEQFLNAFKAIAASLELVGANTNLSNLTPTGEAKFDAKVDLNGSNATFAHIVETYSNGTDWYRVWSNGWCEQGGTKLNITLNTFVFITLLKPFANTNYSVIGSGINAETGTYADEAFSYHPPLQKTGFYGGIRYFTDGNPYATRGFSWKAEGYIS